MCALGVPLRLMEPIIEAAAAAGLTERLELKAAAPAGREHATRG